MHTCESKQMLTTKHRGGVNQTVDPSSCGIILLKVRLELHKEHGHTSGQKKTVS